MILPSKTFVVLLCAILGMTIAGVQTIPVWFKAKDATASSDELNAMVRIAQADTFYFGSTGFTAAPSPTDAMFEYVFFSPKAADLFAWAFEHGTPQGQMFALLGLRHLDTQRCQSLAARLSPSSEVRVASGCIFGKLSSREAYNHQIESGYYDVMVQRMKVHAPLDK